MQLQADIVQAGLEDAEEILLLQKLAYRSEAEIYDDWRIPPLLETVDDTRRDLDKQCVLKVVFEGRIVGSVRFHEENGTCYIGKLIVHPDFQNQGLGTALMRSVEGLAPGSKRFELFTGYRSAKNLYLYRKLGYAIFKQERISDKTEIVYLEKDIV